MDATVPEYDEPPVLQEMEESFEAFDGTVGDNEIVFENEEEGEDDKELPLDEDYLLDVGKGKVCDRHRDQKMNTIEYINRFIHFVSEKYSKGITK